MFAHPPPHLGKAVGKRNVSQRIETAKGLVGGAGSGAASHAALPVAAIVDAQDEGDEDIAQGTGGSDGRHPPNIFEAGHLRAGRVQGRAGSQVSGAGSQVSDSGGAGSSSRGCCQV